MTVRALRCANCSGGIVFPPGQTTTICSYCGFQAALEGAQAAVPPAAPAGIMLATSIGLRTKSGQTFDLLTAGTGVPAQHSELLSTQTDRQESITITLVNGARELATFVFPLQARLPRGVVKVQLLLKVDESGLLTAFVTEHGTTNTTRREGLPIELAR
jgi:hypothetical protein